MYHLTSGKVLCGFSMTIIRQAQMAGFDRRRQVQFEDWMRLHVERCWPQDCANLGVEVGRRVQDGIERARAYGFTSERDVCKFIDLMFGFGVDFDRQQWAQEILATREPRNLGQTMEALCQKGLDRMSEEE